MSILNELYNGNISPSEKFIKKNSEYYKLNGELIDKMSEFTAKLKSEEKARFEEIETYAIKLCAICEEEMYIDGFCTGVKLIQEITNYKSENFK